MLSISKIGNGDDAVKYYTQYAMEQGESEGKWVGRAAQRIAKIYEQKVNSEDMKQVLSGNGISGKRLVKVGKNHTPGWDLTFSAPKSVSVVWANSEDALRSKIEQIQEAATRDALDYLEEHSSRSRTGKGGTSSVKTELLVGLFQHSSNRDLEPQLHTHSVVANVTLGVDGKWRTLDSRHLYKDQKAISAVYKASLAHRMREIGFDVERTKNSFEIVGIGQEIRDFFSSRSKAIENELTSQGVARSSASREQKETATLKSRKKKVVKGSHVESARDFERWQKESLKFGISPDKCTAIRRSLDSNIELSSPKEEYLSRLSSEAFSSVTDQKSVFEKVDFHAFIAEDLIGKGSYDDIKSGIRLAHQSSDLKEMRYDPHRQKYSTKEMLKVEKEIYQSVKSRLNEGRHVVRDKTLRKLIEKKYKTILPEQMEALTESCKSNSGVTYLQGVAGAGKSYTMNAVKDAYQKDGYFVHGVAPTNKAARELSESTAGMETSSIHAFLSKLRTSSVAFSSRSVLIVDEGGMAGSKLQNRLLREARKAKAKVIILGDAKQIQPIEAGQIFGVMHRIFGKKELRNVVRQKGREAAMLLKIRDAESKNDIRSVINYLNETKRLSLERDANGSIEALISDWRDFRRSNPDDSSLIVASKNESVDIINIRIRHHLKKEGVLQHSEQFLKKNGTKIELAVGDRIVFSENSKWRGIYRSDLATITDIKGSKITAEVSKGKFVRFDMKRFSSVEHGYAVTTHRSQGTTVDRAFVYADGPFMDRYKAYVGLTRGRSGNRLYTNEASLGGLSWEKIQESRKLTKAKKADFLREENLASLSGQFFKSSEKYTTLDYRSDSVDEQKSFLRQISEGFSLKIAGIRGSSQSIPKANKGRVADR